VRVPVEGAGAGAEARVTVGRGVAVGVADACCVRKPLQLREPVLGGVPVAGAVGIVVRACG
jgi:hypothetical protein